MPASAVSKTDGEDGAHGRPAKRQRARKGPLCNIKRMGQGPSRNPAASGEASCPTFSLATPMARMPPPGHASICPRPRRKGSVFCHLLAPFRPIARETSSNKLRREVAEIAHCFEFTRASSGRIPPHQSQVAQYPQKPHQISRMQPIREMSVRVFATMNTDGRFPCRTNSTPNFRPIAAMIVRSPSPKIRHFRFCSAGKDTTESNHFHPTDRHHEGRGSRSLAAKNFDRRESWCPRSDSNRHALRRRILNPLRLPFRHSGPVSDL